jgi:hypothetical protein
MRKRGIDIQALIDRVGVAFFDLLLQMAIEGSDVENPVTVLQIIEGIRNPFPDKS